MRAERSKLYSRVWSPRGTHPLGGAELGGASSGRAVAEGRAHVSRRRPAAVGCRRLPGRQLRPPCPRAGVLPRCAVPASGQPAVRARAAAPPRRAPPAASALPCCRVIRSPCGRRGRGRCGVRRRREGPGKAVGSRPPALLVPRSPGQLRLRRAAGLPRPMTRGKLARGWHLMSCGRVLRFCGIEEPAGNSLSDVNSN